MQTHDIAIQKTLELSPQNDPVTGDIKGRRQRGIKIVLTVLQLLKEEEDTNAETEKWQPTQHLLAETQLLD